jgi:hypothetical protein
LDEKEVDSLTKRQAIRRAARVKPPALKTD